MLSKLHVIFLICIFLVDGIAARNNVPFPMPVAGVIMAAIKSCTPEGYDLKEALELIRDGKFNEDEEFKNFILCCYKSSGYANDDGLVDIKEASTLFPEPQEVYKVMEMCNKLKANNPVDTMFNYFKCFQTHTPYYITFDRSMYH